MCVKCVNRLQRTEFRIRYAFFIGAVVALTLLVSCSAFKLDKESNCLNQAAACFKADTTPPRFSSSQPDINQTYTTLDYIDITYSEEPKNGTDTSAYSLPQTGGAANGLQIQYVQKISDYTYRVFLGGASLTTGTIHLDFSGIIDYAGNQLTAPTYVDYTGSANVPIVLSVTYAGAVVSGVSSNGAGAYSNVDISFYHKFIADSANNYSIYITTGATACSGTLIGSGSNLAANTSITPINQIATAFPTALNRVVVCVANQNNPTAVGTASWQLIRDDAPPVMSFDIPPDNYPSPQNITLACSNNMDKIAVTNTTQQGSAPAAPVAPGFDAVGAINATSSLYTGPITAADPANPTYTRFSWQCIDKSGNRSDIVTPPTDYQYYIDTTIPAVNVTLDASFRAYIGPVNTSTTLKFTTDQISKTYNIRRNGTTCTGGGDGTLLVTGTTPASAGTTITEVLNTATHFTTTNTTYPVRICVQGPASIWGTAFLQITTDSTIPAIAPTVAAGTYSAVQAVEFTCTDTNLDKAAYTVSSQIGNVAPTAPSVPTFDTTTGAITSSNTLTGPYITPDSSTTIVKYGCIDLAGNQATVGSVQYTVDATIPAVTLVSTNHTAVTNNAGGYNSVNITWNTTRAGIGYASNDFDIRAGATDCSTGTVVASGLSPTTAGTNVVTNITTAGFPTNGTAYEIKICVKNYAGAMGYQTTPLTITRDDTAPTYAGLTTVSITSGSLTLGWVAASDTGSGVAYYNIYQSTTSGSYSTTPNYVVVAPATGFTVNGLDPTTVYYFIAGVVDSAGNETKVNLAEMVSKPTITLVVAGLSGGGFNVTDGVSSTAVGANTAGTPWATTLSTGATYNFNITLQPSGQICAIKENQFGFLTTSITITVNCVTGNMVGGTFLPQPAAPLNYMLYQGKVSTVVTKASLIRGMTYLNGYIYYVLSPNQLWRILPNGTGDALVPVIFTAGSTVQDLATDGTNIYATEWNTVNQLWKINPTPGSESGTVIAGSATAGSTDGVGTAASFNAPYGLGIDGNYLFITEQTGQRIRSMNLGTGQVTTLYTHPTSSISDVVITNNAVYFTATNQVYTAPYTPGTGTIGTPTVFAGSITSGYVDAIGTAAQFNYVHDLVTDGTNLFVTEYNGNRLRRIKISNAQVMTLAGNGTAGNSNGTGVSAQLSNPQGITTDGRRFFFGNNSGRIAELTDNSLVGYWALNGNAVDHASDVTTAFNGTLQNSPPTVTGRYADSGGALQLDGVNQYVSASGSNLPTGTAPSTQCAWVNPTALPSASHGIVAVAYGGGTTYSRRDLIIQNSAGAPSVLMRSYGSDVTFPYAMQTNVWTHLCATFQHVTAGTQWITVYVNGHNIGKADTPTDWNTGSGSTVIGGLALTPNDNYFNGSIADARIYARLLNEGEINELAQDASPTQVSASYSAGATGLLTHYAFDGASLVDYGPLAILQANSSSATAVIGKDGDANGAFNFSGSQNLTGTDAGLPMQAQPRTLCGWLNPSAYPAVNGASETIVSYGNAATDQMFALALFNLSGVQNISIVKYGTNLYRVYAPPLNSWTHVCGVYTGNTASVYINGQVFGLANEAFIANTQPGNSVPGSLIGKINTAGGYFPGNIDDVRIYNRALSAAEVRQLAVQVPSGLVASYDFSGDANDVSGWGNTLTNNGAVFAADRFGQANASAQFASSAYFNGATAGFPLEAAPRTICAWTNPSTLFNGSFSEVVMYGTSSAGWGFGMDASGGLPNGRIFILDTAGDVVYNKPHGLAIWRHICTTYDGTTEQIYVDGASVTSVGRTLATASGSIFIGKGAFGGGDFFNGNIDDVRVYNRALSLAEIQALVQQQNKRIFVTNNLYTGDLLDNGGVSGAPTGVTGIAGADAKCNWALDSNKPATGTYKAMLGDGGTNCTGAPCRQACTTANCTGSITENIDWVLRPNITYLRSDGLTPIFTADWNSVFNFNSGANNFSYSIGTGTSTPWTGLEAQWVTDSSMAASWTSSAVNGVWGTENSTTDSVTPGSGVLYNFWGTGMNTLYCVEQ